MMIPIIIMRTIRIILLITVVALVITIIGIKC